MPIHSSGFHRTNGVDGAGHPDGAVVHDAPLPRTGSVSSTTRLLARVAPSVVVVAKEESVCEEVLELPADSALDAHCHNAVVAPDDGDGQLCRDPLGASNTIALEDSRCDSGVASVVMAGPYGAGHHNADGAPISLGVCCMAKKLRSDTMVAMLRRFEAFQLFCIVPFEEDMILNAPVEQWPHVDVMISFFSSGFPLDKAIEYAQRHPDIYFLTHPASQRVLLDRRDFYSALRRNNVPMIRSVYCNRDGYLGRPPSVFEECIEEEWISIDGERVYKPFVEKPVDSEDHNVYIYFDRTRGGGCRMLFRKKENQSSEFDAERLGTRKEGSFVYEDYVETSGLLDVKCYTVGPNFVHAEQRKAPCVDGIVFRSPSGKEVREEVELTSDEKMVARKVIKVFRQMVCGFDILRADTGDGKQRFYVCDVNGWSFVKNNPEYVEKATAIMRDIFVEEVRKRGLHRVCTQSRCYSVYNSSDNVATLVINDCDTSAATDRAPSAESTPPLRPRSIDDGAALIHRELIGVVGILRHADRTPKQKVKILLSAEVILDLVFEEASPTAGRRSSGGGAGGGECSRGAMQRELVFKSGNPVLERIRACAQRLLDEMESSADTSSRGSTDVTGTVHVKTYPSATAAATSTTTGSPGKRRDIPFRAHTAGDNPTQSVEEQLRLMVDVLGRKHEGLKVQIRPNDWDSDGRCTEALVICKWGGWLTEAGHKQAEMLGNHFIRRIFGAEPSEKCVSRDQLNITTNNERRVIYTGLDFARCLLKDASLNETHCHINENLLGSSRHAKEVLEQISNELRNIMHMDTPDEVASILHIPGIPAVLDCPVLEPCDRSPLGAMRTLHRLMEQLVAHIPSDEQSLGEVPLYRSEPLHLMRLRWQTLSKAFYNKKKNAYDTTKITDIFDYVSYDVCYNQEALAPLDLYPLFTLAEVVSQFASDAEYGTNADQKRMTGCLIATPLLHRICADLHALAKHQTPRTRLYFTSESHVMALKNLLYHSHESFHRLDEPQELHFLTHFVFKVYQYHHSGAVQLEVHFSAGIDKNMFGIVQEHHVEYNAVTPMIRIHNDLSLRALDDIDSFYGDMFRELVPLGAVSPHSSSEPEGLRAAPPMGSDAQFSLKHQET